jgi:hypothetical protein
MPQCRLWAHLMEVHSRRRRRPAPQLLGLRRGRRRRRLTLAHPAPPRPWVPACCLVLCLCGTGNPSRSDPKHTHKTKQKNGHRPLKARWREARARDAGVMRQLTRHKQTPQTPQWPPPPSPKCRCLLAEGGEADFRIPDSSRCSWRASASSLLACAAAATAWLGGELWLPLPPPAATATASLTAIEICGIQPAHQRVPRPANAFLTVEPAPPGFCSVSLFLVLFYSLVCFVPYCAEHNCTLECDAVVARGQQARREVN